MVLSCSFQIPAIKSIWHMALLTLTYSCKSMGNSLLIMTPEPSWTLTGACAGVSQSPAGFRKLSEWIDARDVLIVPEGPLSGLGEKGTAMEAWPVPKGKPQTRGATLIITNIANITSTNNDEKWWTHTNTFLKLSDHLWPPLIIPKPSLHAVGAARCL